MKITLVGPRSVGKSTISKLLGKKIKVIHIESDKIMNNKLKKYGGLDKVIKTRKSHLIAKESIPLTKEILKNKKFIFDLAGGAISSKKHKKVSQMITKLISKNSIVIGLFPSKSDKESIEFLFNREVKRKHFRKTNKSELKKEVKINYLKLKQKLKKHANIIIYVKDKTSSKIVNEIMERIK